MTGGTGDGTGDATTRATAVVTRLRRRGETLAVAESLTGGDLCGALVAVPGASSVLRGGVVAYASDVKAGLLGVDGGLLATVGAVDARVARQMASGARRLLAADWAVSTTGVAGPGPAAGRLPGTVHLAVAGPAGEVAVERLLDGDRAQVRAGAVDAALELLLAGLSGGRPDGDDLAEAEA